MSLKHLKFFREMTAAGALFLVHLNGFAADQSTQQRSTDPKQTTLNTQASAAYQDIEKTLGVMPKFVKNYPPEAISSAWTEVKGLLFNPNTAVSGKQKSLISFAVDSQIPCQNCSYLDGELAKVSGATSPELNEAVAIAAHTRHWSTFLNGLQIDENNFRSEVRQIVKTMKQKAAERPPRQEAGTVAITTPEDAYRDMKRTIGVVPEFLKQFPKEGIVGAWNKMKDLQLNPNTAITPKNKELIGLAVSAQIPCHYCTLFHTEAAKLDGASEQEIRESVAYAGITREWSAVMNGSEIDRDNFRQEVQKMAQHLKAAQTPPQVQGQPMKKDTTQS